MCLDVFRRQTRDSTIDPERDPPGASPAALWGEEVEVQDKESQEAIEISLLFDMTPT